MFLPCYRWREDYYILINEHVKSYVQDVIWTVNVVGPANTIAPCKFCVSICKQIVSPSIPCQWIACWCMTSNYFGKVTQNIQAGMEIEIVQVNWNHLCCSKGERDLFILLCAVDPAVYLDIFHEHLDQMQRNVMKFGIQSLFYILSNTLHV